MEKPREYIFSWNIVVATFKKGITLLSGKFKSPKTVLVPCPTLHTSENK